MPITVTKSHGTLRPLLLLVWPVLVEQFLAMLVGFSDTVLAGHYLERQHLAAMTLMAYLLWALSTFFAVVAIGATAMTARFTGAEDPVSANKVVNQSLLIGVLLATITTLLGLIFGSEIVRVMQLEGEPAALATRYLRIVMPMMPFMMLEEVSIASLRGAGDMVTGLITMILVNVINIAVSWSLLLGIGPLPQLGWDGIAIGTACGHILGGIIPVAVLARGRAGLKLRLNLLRPDVGFMRRILRIGLPGGADALSVVGCQLLFLGLVNQLGELAAAAHGVAIRLESVAYLPGTAFEVAAATLAGQYLGARDYRRARRSVLVACLAVGMLMFSAALILFFGADWLVPLFVGHDEVQVVQTAAPLVRIVSFALVPLGWMMVLTGALRGAGDTRLPLLFTLFGFLAVRMPLAYWLSHTMGLGVRGAWYAMAADLVVRCLLVLARFLQGGWAQVEV